MAVVWLTRRSQSWFVWDGDQNSTFDVNSCCHAQKVSFLAFVRIFSEETQFRLDFVQCVYLSMFVKGAFLMPVAVVISEILRHPFVALQI
jgi:hypothetical protein